ncbi:MAG: Rne/Rng family ribonuclease [Gammaproteobacteria bacterium]|nr:Rne/Rng family ribonuclease [Gammaproteobacteria bacterium]MYK43697.1 Rne/Rng family ribonuclease [Gammaproteobacteria bacterium]
MKVMLVNVLPEREVRIAIAELGEAREPSLLLDYYVENFAKRSTTGNVYKAKIAAVNEQLQAAFVDYGDIKQGLLTLNKISGRHTYRTRSRETQNETSITELVREGDDILVQVDKDPRGEKGASVTCFLQIQGQHIVLNARRTKLHISRMITGKERVRLERVLEQLEIPNNMGLVIRTSARDKTLEVIQEDLDECVSLMQLIEKAYEQSVAPRLLYEANNMVQEVLRDNLHSDIKKVFIDDLQVYNEVLTFVKNFMPDFTGEIQNYTDALPLFTKYRVENQTNIVFDRVVQLPSGGQIVLDPTEALLAIDVNSARSHYSSNFRELALKTNLEAAEAVFRQLRLRDIGGLIVIDFIDMYSEEDVKDLENLVDQLCTRDRGRTRWEALSQFGMMQLQRRRSKSSIYETEFDTCKYCGGHGIQRTIASVSHRILREIEARCHGRHITLIRTHITKNVADFITTQLRTHMVQIEMKSRAKLEFVLDQHRDDSTYTVEAFMHPKSAKPIQKRSYERGVPEGITSRSRKIIDRPEPMKEIQQAAVVRPEITRTAAKRAKVTPAHRQTKSTFMESLMRIVRFPVWITKRLFVVAPEQQKRNENQKGKKSQSRVSRSKSRKKEAASRKNFEKTSSTRNKAKRFNRNVATIETKIRDRHTQNVQAKSSNQASSQKKQKPNASKSHDRPQRIEAQVRQKPIELSKKSDTKRTPRNANNSKKKPDKFVQQDHPRQTKVAMAPEKNRIVSPKDTQTAPDLVTNLLNEPTTVPQRKEASETENVGEAKSPPAKTRKPHANFTDQIKISPIETDVPTSLVQKSDEINVPPTSKVNQDKSNGDPNLNEDAKKTRAGNDPRSESRINREISIIIS